MTDSLMPSALTAPIFSSAAMRAILDDRARLQRMLDFAAALARAEAAVGVIPASAVGDIASACHAERYDLAALGQATITAGNVATPLIALLAAEVAKRSEEAARYVQLGASNQDLIDTTLALELRAGIDALVADLDRAIKAFTTLAGRHRRTLTLAKIDRQQTLSVPFGLKFAGYAAALGRSRERVRRVRRETLALQFGGNGGTLAALGEQGIEVSGRLAALLDLAHPDAPWHGHRDRLAEAASALAVLAGGCSEIAGDIALMLQSGTGELYERTSQGKDDATASAPRPIAIAANAAQSAAAMAPGLLATILATHAQEHERDLRSGQPEGTLFSTLLLVSSGALQAIVEIAEGLEINIERMKSNIEASGAAASSQGSAQTFLDRLVASSLSRFTRRPADVAPRMPDAKPAQVAAEKSKAEPTPSAPEPVEVASTSPADELPPAAPPPAPAEPTIEVAAPASSAEERSALLEAFTRVAEVTDPLAAKPPLEDESKPA